MKKKELIKVLIELLINNDLFKNYKSVISQNMLVKEGIDIIDMLEFELQTTYNFSDETDLDEYYKLKVSITRQFKFLHQWSHKFSFKSKTDLKYQYTLIESNDELINFTKKEKYELTSLEPIVEYIVDFVIQSNIQKNYPTLKEYYQNYKQPLLIDNSSIVVRDLIMFDNSQFTMHGFDWIVESLLLTYMFNKSKYTGLKSKLTTHFESLCLQGEPNAIYYKDIFDEIVRFNENLVM